MKKNRSFGGLIFDIFNGLLMLISFIVMIYPFLYILNYSLAPVNSIRAGTLLLYPPKISLDAYNVLLRDKTIYKAFLVSAARSILGPLLTIIVTGMAGFVLSQKKLVFGRFLRLFTFLTMYVSAGIIPGYIFMHYYRLPNTFWVYIIPSLVSAFNIVLIKTYIESLPDSMQEAVLIDGGNELQMYWKVIFPVCLPVNAAIILFSVIAHWNMMIDTQLYNTMRTELYTLQYVLYSTLARNLNLSLEKAQDYAKQSSVNTQSIKMAITVITIFPIMIVYPFLQKYFVSGILVGAVKG